MIWKIVISLLVWILASPVYMFLSWGRLKESGGYWWEWPILIPSLGIAYCFGYFEKRRRRGNPPVVVMTTDDNRGGDGPGKYICQVRGDDEHGIYWTIDVYSDKPMVAKIYGDNGKKFEVND